MTHKKELQKIKITRLQRVREALLKVMKNHPYLTTQEWRELIKANGGFNEAELKEELLTHGLEAMENELVLQAMATMKDGTGQRLFHNFTIMNQQTGEPERVNYQEALFDLECYTTVAPKPFRGGITLLDKAKKLNDNCIKKFKVNVLAAVFDYDIGQLWETLKLNETGKSAKGTK